MSTPSPNPDPPTALAAHVVARCRALGFAAAGIAPATPTAHGAALRGWLDAGRHGEMGYLAERAEIMADPRRFVPGARSIVCVADRYHDGAPDPPAAADGAPRGRIARYARGGDYHRVMRRRLHVVCDELRERFPDERFRAAVDTAPLLEREHAARAGLGAIGKHTLLIESGIGSYLLLGAIVTTLALEPTRSPAAAPVDPCGSCTRCLDACPTDAITPWSVDATRCISYLTIEHRSAIEPALAERTGDWLFGCDVCQEVCPHNQPTERARAAPVHEAYAPRRDGFDLLDVLGWTEEDRREAFARSPMKRAKLAMIRRNAAAAAGNALRGREDAALRDRLLAIAADENEDATVRAAARSAASA